MPILIALLLAVANLSVTAPAASPPSPTAQAQRDARGSLVDADRAFAAQAATGDALAGLRAIFADDALMPLPGQGFVEGPAAISAALARDSTLRAARLTWTPLRAEVSGDGLHGMTAGFLTVNTAAGGVREFKYLAYWLRKSDGWRVQVWRRVPRNPGEVRRALEASVAAAGPRRALEPSAYQRTQRELQQMEQVFSDSAQRIGLGPAFALFGATDAIHLGGRGEVDFIRGREAIAANVSQGLEPGTSPVVWSAERTFLAPSGDFGVNLGFIKPLNGAAAPGQGFPFFTIWRRGADGAWRYIAE